MKKTIIILFALIQVLLMTSCAKPQSRMDESSSIDATSISQRISAPCFAVTKPSVSDGSWTYNCFSSYEDSVFYIAGKEDVYFVAIGGGRRPLMR